MAALPLGWDRKLERRSVLIFRLRPNPAPITLDDFFANRQTHTTASVLPSMQAFEGSTLAVVWVWRFAKKSSSVMGAGFGRSLNMSTDRRSNLRSQPKGS